MRVSTSGTRERLTGVQREFIRRRILALPAGTVVITGGCLGVDAFIARVAFQASHLKVHTIMPGDRRHADPDWKLWCDTYEEMPRGTTFRQRDVAVVEDGDNLLAFPLYRRFPADSRSRRSGTWMTVGIAERAGKPVEWFVLDDIPPGWSNG